MTKNSIKAELQRLQKRLTSVDADRVAILNRRRELWQLCREAEMGDTEIAELSGVTTSRITQTLGRNPAKHKGSAA